MKKLRVKAQRFDDMVLQTKRRRQGTICEAASKMRGELSIFLALLSVIFLSLFLSLMDGAWVGLSKSNARRFSILAINSVFGEYQTELFQDYEVFGLDCGYRAGAGSEENILAHYRDYLSYHTDMGKALSSLGVPVNWRLTLTDAEVTAKELLTDRGGAPFREQISEAMQMTLGIEAVQKLVNGQEDVSEIRKLENTWETESEQNEKALAKSKEQAKEEQSKEEQVEEPQAEEEQTEIETKNPIAEAKTLKGGSILHTVLENPDSVSRQTIETDDLVSGRDLKQGYGESTWNAQRNAFMDSVLFREYILNCAGSYGKETEENTALQYEAEYVLFGKASDIENLEAMAGRLLLIREALNFAYLCTDTSKQAEAETWGTTLAALLMIPEFAEVFKWGLLLAWAYGESVLDVRTLFAGGKVPLWKTAETWEIGLFELASLSDGSFRTRKNQEEGIGYIGNLRLLLYLGGIEKQTYRMLDLTEARIRNSEGSPSFYADSCVVGIEIKSTWSTTHGITYTFPVQYAYQ